MQGFLANSATNVGRKIQNERVGEHSALAKTRTLNKSWQSLIIGFLDCVFTSLRFSTILVHRDSACETLCSSYKYWLFILFFTNEIGLYSYTNSFTSMFQQIWQKCHGNKHI